MGWSHRYCDVDRTEVQYMIYGKLLKLKDELGKKSLRKPRTADEILSREKYERVMNILWKRYEHGVSEALMEQYRYGDFRDEIATVKKI